MNAILTPGLYRAQTVLCLAAVLGFAVPSAQPQTPLPLAQASGAGPSSSPFSLQMHVPLVVEDVVVLDGNNHPIYGLKAADFTVTENGQPVAPLSFEEHTAVTAAQAAAALKPPNLGTNVYTNMPTVPVNSALNILLLDALNTPMTDQIRLHQQMLQYLKTLPPGERIAIFGLGSRLYLLQDFTTNPSVLQAAIDSKRGKIRPSTLIGDSVSGGPVEQLSTISAGIMRINPNDDSSMSLLVLESMRQFDEDIHTYQTTQRVEYTLQALGQLARYLSALPGRKNLIWFSGSFPIYIQPDLSLSQDPFRVMANYGDDLRRTTNLLARSQVVVYPVDARGLFGNSADDASQTTVNLNIPTPYGVNRNTPNAVRYGGTNLNNVASLNTNFQQQTATEHLTMDQVAADTGGKAFYNTGGLKDAVESAINIGSNYYTFSYTPPEHKWDNKFRKVEVKVDKPGAHLSYRKGYFADDPDAEVHGKKKLPVGPMQAAMMHGAPDANELLFKVRVTPGDTPTNKIGEGSKPDRKLMKPPYRNYTLDALLDVRNVKMPLNSAGLYQGAIEFVALVYDAEGNLVNTATRVGRASLPAERFAPLLQHGLDIRQSIDVPAQGNYYLRIGIHDLGSDRVGAVEIPIAALKSHQAMLTAVGQSAPAQE
ncbi:MAG: VWA domain-containing protein [Terracidiphilus sp.]|nr:VWA domain-containing protein [Terracidiphilus sp.]